MAKPKVKLERVHPLDRRPLHITHHSCSSYVGGAVPGNICAKWLCRRTGSSRSEAEPTRLCICSGVCEPAGGSPERHSPLEVTRKQAEPNDVTVGSTWSRLEFTWNFCVVCEYVKLLVQVSAFMSNQEETTAPRVLHTGSVSHTQSVTQVKTLWPCQLCRREIWRPTYNTGKAEFGAAQGSPII